MAIVNFIEGESDSIYLKLVTTSGTKENSFLCQNDKFEKKCRHFYGTKSIELMQKGKSA